MSSALDRLRVPCFLVGVALVLFTPFWLRGQVFVPNDLLGFLYPWKGVAPRQPRNLETLDVPVQFYPEDVFIAERLREGDLPLWNPRVFSGHPLLSNGHTPLLYPPRNLLLRHLHPAVARTVSLLLHLTAMGLSMYWWLRCRDLEPTAAGLGGLCWMLNAYVASWLEFEHVLVVGTYLPLALLGLDRGREGSAAWWGLAALSCAAMLVGGHVQYALYALPLVVLYSLLQGWRSGKPARAAAGVIAAGLGAALLAAPLLLPFLEFQSEMQRRDLRMEEQTPALWTYLPTLLCPDVYGNPARGFLLNRTPNNLLFSEYADYFGVLPLLLALTAVLHRGRASRGPGPAETYCWAGGAVLCLLFAAATPLYAPLLALFSFLRKLVPMRILFLFAFCCSVLGALGLQRLLDHPGAGRLLARLGAATAVAWGLVLASLGLLLGGARPHLRAAIASLEPWRIKIPPPDSPDLVDLVLDRAAGALVGNPQMWLPLLLGTAAWIGGRHVAARTLAPRRAAWMVLGATAADLLLFAAAYNPAMPVSEVLPTTPALQYLTSREGVYRVEKRHAGFYNTLTPYGLELLTGYESLFPRRYLLTMAAIEPGARLAMRSIALDSFESPIVDAMNLRYVLVPPWESLASDRWREVYSGPDGRIFENTRALPRAYVVGEVRVFPDFAQLLGWMAGPEFRPAEVAGLEEPPPGPVVAAAAGSPVRFRRREPDRLLLEADMAAPGLLILADSWHAGWSARVDGRRVGLLRANGVARAVWLDAGPHRVEMEFLPEGYRRGLMGASAAAGVILLAGIGALWRRVRSC